jgi:hypothetical protein
MRSENEIKELLLGYQALLASHTAADGPEAFLRLSQVAPKEALDLIRSREEWEKVMAEIPLPELREWATRLQNFQDDYYKGAILEKTLTLEWVLGDSNSA